MNQLQANLIDRVAEKSGEQNSGDDDEAEKSQGGGKRQKREEEPRMPMEITSMFEQVSQKLSQAC